MSPVTNCIFRGLTFFNLFQNSFDVSLVYHDSRLVSFFKFYQQSFIFIFSICDHLLVYSCVCLETKFDCAFTRYRIEWTFSETRSMFVLDDENNQMDKYKSLNVHVSWCSSWKWRIGWTNVEVWLVEVLDDEDLCDLIFITFLWMM